MAENWSTFETPKNCKATNKHYLTQLKQLNSIVSTKDDKFYYNLFYDTSNVIPKLNTHFDRQDYDYSTRAQLLRTLINALDLTKNIPFDVRKAYSTHREQIINLQQYDVDSDLDSNDIQVIDRAMILERLRSIRDNIRLTPGIRSIAAWFASMDNASGDMLVALKKIKLNDFNNTRLDEPRQYHGYFNYRTANDTWKIYNECSKQPETFVRSPIEYRRWVRDHISNGRWLAPKRDGSRYTQTSTLSQALKDLIGLDFNTIKQAILNNENM